MKVYCDVCTICRLFDNQMQPRVAAEARAFLRILEQIERGIITLISSDTLVTEISNNPDRIRRQFSESIIVKATEFAETSEEIVRMAEGFQNLGIKAMDSFHLASAVIMDADYFITCDDRLQKKCRLVNTGHTMTVSPIDLTWEESQ